MEAPVITTATCRTCLSNNSDILDLHSLMKSTNSNKTYKQILEELIQTEFTDEQEINLPQHICHICCRQLQHAYGFIKQTRKSYDELIKLFSPVKFNDDCFAEKNIDVPVDKECEAESIDVSMDEDECDVNSVIHDTPFAIEQVDIKIADYQFLEFCGKLEYADENNTNFEQEINYYSKDDHNLNTSQKEADTMEKCSKTAEKEITTADIIYLECPHCDYVTSLQHLMDYHINSKHEKVENSIQCHFCRSTFVRRFGLLVHMQNNHKQAVKDLKVEMNFNRKRSSSTSMEDNDDNAFIYYLLNMQKRTPDTNPLKCKQCDYSAYNRPAMDHHYQQKHAMDNKFDCRFCEKSYTTKWDLSQHITNNHAKEVKAGKKTISNSTMKGHEIRNNDIPIDDVKNETIAVPELDQENDELKCKFCGKLYKRKFHLLQHLKLHIKQDVISPKKNNDNEEKNEELESELKAFESEDTIADIELVESVKLPDDDDNNVEDETQTYTNDADENVYDDGHDDGHDDLLTIEHELNDETVQWLCKYCDHTAKSKRALHYHQRKKHSENMEFVEENKFKCRFCEKSYTRKHSLLIHMRGSHKEDFSQLKIEMDFQRKKSTKKDEVHSQNDNDDTETQSCQYCDFVTASKRSFKYHLKFEHGINKDDFKCLFCETSYSRKYFLYMHIKLNHIEDIKTLRKKKAEENLEEAVDDDDATQSADYNQALQNNDFNDEDDAFLQSLLYTDKKSAKLRYMNSLPSSCDICGKTYANIHRLNSHKLLRHNPEVAKRFPCTLCSKYFKRNWDLKVHVGQVHTKIKPPPPPVKRTKKPKKESNYLCSYCSYCCNKIQSLNLHIMRRHTNEHPFQCDLCDKSFITSFQLKTHSYLHTGEKPFKCPICSKGFRANAQMKKHKLTHNNERPYKCQECDKSYTHRDTLIWHNRTRHSLVSLTCNVCNKKFKDSASINVHRINEQHPDE